MSWNYFTQCGQNFPFSRIFYRVILYWEICANYSIFIFKLFYILAGAPKISTNFIKKVLVACVWKAQSKSTTDSIPFYSSSFLFGARSTSYAYIQFIEFLYSSFAKKQFYVGKHIGNVHSSSCCQEMAETLL